MKLPLGFIRRSLIPLEILAIPSHFVFSCHAWTRFQKRVDCRGVSRSSCPSDPVLRTKVVSAQCLTLQVDLMTI